MRGRRESHKCADRYQKIGFTLVMRTTRPFQQRQANELGKNGELHKRIPLHSHL